MEGHGFTMVAGDFDGAGLTWGIIGFTLKHGEIQRIVQERVVFAPIWENGFIRAFGPRMEEAALNLIPSFPYAGPPEDLRLKAR